MDHVSHYPICSPVLFHMAAPLRDCAYDKDWDYEKTEIMKGQRGHLRDLKVAKCHFSGLLLAKLFFFFLKGLSHGI